MFTSEQDVRGNVSQERKQHLFNKRRSSYINYGWSSLVALSRGWFSPSGDVRQSLETVATRFWLREVRGAAERRAIIHRTSSTATKNHPAPNVHRAEGEKPWSVWSYITQPCLPRIMWENAWIFCCRCFLKQNKKLHIHYNPCHVHMYIYVF